MTALEIIVVVCIALFTIAVILVCFGFDLKKFFKWLWSGSKQKKSKSFKTKKEKPVKDKKEKTKKVKEEKLEDKKSEEQTEQEKPEKKPRAFTITKKGVARINKKAIERDSRTGAIIEQAIKPKDKAQEVQEESKPVSFKDFDDLLEKLKDIGDPDELDDETFNKLFMSSAMGKSIMGDDEMSDDFISSESPATGKIDRKLKRFTIDGSHLNLDKRYDDYPSRMPTLDMDHLVFTDRITGRYDNIKMGDVSNVLQPPEQDGDNEVKAQDNEENDEEIFAKIMERRRRELGLESAKNKNEQDASYIDPTTLIIADAIANPKFKQNKNNSQN